ncbi:MAG TPA: siderophore-interacting protein [Trueperaceae bacterium]|nr:siderophore-interacting protein [Trueperaceae bacterium]
MTDVATTARSAKARQVITAVVSSRRRLSPSFARLTLVGGGLEQFEHKGFDQWFRLFLPHDGAGRMPVPVADVDADFYQQFLSSPEEERTWMRYVTVRSFRPTAVRGPELDVDVVVHGQAGARAAGPLSTWAQAAEPGDRVAIFDQGLIFRKELLGDELLLLGDETAVPAIAGILESLPAATSGRVWLEVPGADDFQELTAPLGMEVTWLARADASPGSGLLAAFRARVTAGASFGAGHRASLGTDPDGLDRSDPSEHPYLYAAGETAMIKSLNQLLLDELRWPKGRMTTVGYWHFTAGGHA